MDALFNVSPLVENGRIEQPEESLVKATPSLWQASLETALKYGGELTRAALGAMNIRGDRRHVVVDTKVHMLMPGQCPAIPGWHTDGAPRAHADRPGPNAGALGWSPLGLGPLHLRRPHSATARIAAAAAAAARFWTVWLNSSSVPCISCSSSAVMASASARQATTATATGRLELELRLAR